MNITIRNENPNDQRAVEELTREAFWNLYVMGCDEHYLVHIMRDHPDFISYLNFVAETDGKIVGNIMYTKSHIVDQSDNRIETISFGPISVLPQYQRQGVGSALIRHSIDIALKHNHKILIIQGHPHNYLKHGFKNGKDFNISDSDGTFPYSLLVLELEKGVIPQGNWKYFHSDVYLIDSKDAQVFDEKNFPPKKKEYQYTQYEFELSCRAFVGN